ncbi:hypothetical protein TIFTF001_040293 [Ficus carica]|uniref:Uncharacterized protein n=1 Tax=Ficus carica TaxID=3494 RepID=A0AA87YUU8_FICCA|nr:hypothetical protein TIFTF001_040293 [Ficus carica]
MCGSYVEKYVSILIVKKYLICNNNRSLNSSFVFCHSENFGIGGKWRGLKSSLRNMSPIKSGPHDVELSQWVPLLTLLERLVVPLIRKVSLSLVSVPRTSSRPGLVILSTKGILDTFRCSGQWSSLVTNNNYDLGINISINLLTHFSSFGNMFRQRHGLIA